MTTNELTKEHIKRLVENFYNRVQTDDLLGPIFNDVAKVDWEHHIPLLCSFWNSIMLKTNEYHGNAFAKHVEISKLASISEAHFQRWLQIFQEEANTVLPYNVAQEILTRANLIANKLKTGMLVSHCSASTKIRSF
jgi:hemoglobin